MESPGLDDLDADVTRLLRMSVPRPDSGGDIRVAGTGLVDYGEDQEVSEEIPRAVPARFREEAIGVREPEREPRRVGEAFIAYLSIYCCKGDPGGRYCERTASGASVAPGMAACSLHWSFGTVFEISLDSPYRKVVVCEDRGSGVTAWNHLDVFFYDCGDQQDPAPGTGWAWLQALGTRVEVRIVE